MKTNFRSVRQSSWLSGTLMLASLVFVIAILYWAREILIPIALAILLTFILAPLVSALRRWGLGRTTSVIVTVTLAFVLIGGIGAMIGFQFRNLAHQLPNYRENIREKVSDLRIVSKGGTIEKVQQTVKEVMDEINQDEAPKVKADGAVPVIVTEQKPPPQPISTIIGPLLEPLGSAGLVMVLVIFMLLRREDLRDRLLRLAGYGRLVATTKAIDEAGKGVSRYLLRQFLLNASFGLEVGIGLFFIGLPYALLWGFLAGVARFIPYVGPCLGAVAPVLMSLAVFDGWMAPLLVIGLVVVLECINNLVLEPLVYGQSMGASEVALLIMMAFWTWLWGPIGLVLAAPLTVCLLVASKSVPDLEFLHLLLSSEPALGRHHAFYQRLVAKDQDEAQDIVETFLKEHSRADLFEQLLIPTLASCRHDYQRNRLTDEDRDFVFRAISEILDLDGAPERASVSPSERGIMSVESPVPNLRASEPRRLILGCPANDEADELALRMLGELLSAAGCEMRILSSQRFSLESLAEVEKARPAVVCLGYLSGGPLLPLRQFCKRLRARCPEVPVVLGRWAAGASTPRLEQFSGPVNAVGLTLTETKNQVLQFGQITPGAGGASSTEVLQPTANSQGHLRSHEPFVLTEHA